MKKILIIFLILNWLIPIEAQIEEMINPSDLKQQTVITEPTTLNKGFFRTGIISNYGTADKVFDESGKKSYISGSSGWASSWTIEMGIQYGLLDRLEVLVDVPYLHEQIFISSLIDAPGPDSSFTSAYKTKAAGLGDMSLGTEFQILKEDERMPSLSATVLLTLPTGRKNPENIKSPQEFDRPTGSGETSLYINLQLRKIIYPYSYTIYSFYIYHFEGSKIFNPGEEETNFKSGDIFYLGGSFNLHLNDWIALMNEAAFFKWWDDEYYGTTARDVGISNRWGVNYQASLVFQIKRFRFAETILVPVYGQNYTQADPSYTLGLFYTF
ncbi:MAG: hypothetical protein ISS19_13870 [Bacteroidales bacterium]|nr:hypothetical protein [Bacteroidales bacterium]